MSAISQVSDAVLLRRLQAEGFVWDGKAPTIEQEAFTLGELALVYGIHPQHVGGGLGFVHKKIGGWFKRRWKFVRKGVKKLRKVKFGKIIAIGLAITAAAVFLPMVGLPIVKLTGIVGSKAAGLIKGGAVFTQKVITGAGKVTVALLTAKQRKQLTALGVKAAVAIGESRLRQISGVSQAQIMDDWSVQGDQVLFSSAQTPTEITADDGISLPGGLTPVVLIGGGVLLLFAISKSRPGGRR